MRDYQSILQAVRDGTETTMEELQYALTTAHYFLARLYFDGKEHLAAPTMKTRDKLERNFASFDDVSKRDLETFLKGSSMEPGIPPDERRRRTVNRTATVGARLFETLTNLSNQKR